MSSEINVLFTSDIHLGIDEKKTEIPQDARINSFKKIVAIAMDYDVFLIGGDLIDNADVSDEIIELISTEFQKLRESGTEIIFTPGIGEISKNDIVPSFIFDLNLTHVFSNTSSFKPYIFSKGKQKLYFYGMPASNSFNISKIKKSNNDGFHIGLFHVDSDFEDNNGQSQIYKLNKKDMRILDLDFYTLGHNHSFKMFKVMDKIIGVCSGSPESVFPEETGDRFVISISIENNEIAQIRRLTVNSLKLCSDCFDCSQLTTVGPIKELLENNKSNTVIQKLRLFGDRDFLFGCDKFEKYKSKFNKLEVIDNSIPSMECLLEEYQYENSLRGEFYKVLKEQIDRNGISNKIDLPDLAATLNEMTRHGFNNLEEWLCKL